MYAIATLCYIMAMGMALPSQMAVSEDFKAEVQCHLRTPSWGCIEVSHSVGGSVFRSYAGDGPSGEFIEVLVATTTLWWFIKLPHLAG